MLDDVLNPPFKSTMPVRKITSVNDSVAPGQVITANTYVVSNRDLDPNASTDMSYPSAILKLHSDKTYQLKRWDPSLYLIRHKCLL